MLVIKADELDNFDAGIGTSVTIGKFDGVHLGHRKLIDETVRYARYAGLLSCVITFKNAENTGGDGMRLLTTFEEKCHIMEKSGVDVLVVLEFTEVLKNMSAADFIDFFLGEMLNVSSVTVGEDFCFGKNREGSVKDLSVAQMEYGYNLTVMKKEEADGDQISSTRIRNLIKEGNLKEANDLLGYDYLIEGITESGKRKGREIGVPTVNLYPSPEKLIPPFGVYASKAVLEGKEYNAVTNIGVCPTVIDNKKISVETHLLKFTPEKETYGEKFYVYLHDHIREEIKFDSVNRLYDQMQKDIQEAEKLLAKP